MVDPLFPPHPISMHARVGFECETAGKGGYLKPTVALTLNRGGLVIIAREDGVRLFVVLHAVTFHKISCHR